MPEIYENIKMYRKQNKMTQDELAKRMGYTDRSSIAKVENGSVDLPISKIVQFAEVFNVDPGELMGWDEGQNEKPTTPEDDGLTENHRKLIEFAKTLPEDKAEMMLSVMKTILGDS